jgi:AAA domain-containing protein
MSDDIRKAYETGRGRPRLAYDREEAPAVEPFGLQPLRILDQRQIKHRQWLYGTHLIRGFVTLLIAPGGTGKSSLILAMCMELAINRSLLGARIHQQCNTALLNLEDPQDEVDRRVTALALRYGITNDHIEGRFFVSPADRAVRIAANSDDGFSVVHPDEKQIIEKVKDERIGVLAVDPFAESHTLEENSNPQMIQAAAAWRRVARFGNCSVLLAHHVRKGTVDSIEAARGAKALTDSARVGLLLSTMTTDDANALGIPADDRLQYARLDDAKANLAPRAPKASWFRLDHVVLDNADATYPHGDQVVVIESWEPPSVWDSMPVRDCNIALDRIEAGLPGGGRYTNNRRGGGERWAGAILVEMFDFTEAQAASVIKTWIANGVLSLETYKDSGRKERTGLRVNHTKRPGG